MIGSFRVSPGNVRRTVVRATGLASGDRRDDRQIVTVLQRRLEPRPEPNVLVISVDVDELAKLTLVVVEPLPEARKLLVQLIECLGHVTGIDLDDGRPASELPQRAGHANFYRHGVVHIISRYGGGTRPAASSRSRI